MNKRNPLNLGFRRITSAADDPRPDKDHHLMDREKNKSMRNFEQTRAEKSEETRSKRDESSSPNLVASTASREGSVSSERSGSIEDTNMDEALEGSGSDAKEEPEFYKSPDDVVGLIGTKFFWKLRANVNQQRIFAMQVFELHRFIKVQEHLSGLPDVLLEGITPLEAPVEDPSDFLVSPQKQLFKAKGQSDLVNVNHQQKVDRSSAWPLPWYLQTTEKNDQWFLPYPPSRVPLTSSNGGPGPVPEAQQQMSIGLPVSGAEVDQLRRESRSSSNVAIPKKRVFSEKFRCISSNLLVERGSMTPLRSVSPLEGPSSSTLGSSSLTYLPWVSPLEGSCSSTPLPRVSPLKDPGSLSPLPRLSPLEESSSLTPLPRVSPLEVSSSLTPLFRVSTLESSDPLTPLPRVSPLESSALLAHLPRVSPLEGSYPLIPLPRVSPRESSRQQSQVIRVVQHESQIND